MARWEEFRQCPGCKWNPATDEGIRNCSYYDCPYLPAELDVYCPNCRFDFYTLDGNPSCEDPSTCSPGEESRSHVPNVHRWLEVAS